MEYDSKTLEVGFAAERKQRANSAYVFGMRDGKMTWTYPGLVPVAHKGADGMGTGEFTMVDAVLTLDPAKVSAVNRARAMIFGLKQRVNDAAALEAGPDGRVDRKAKYDEQRRMIEHLESGTDDWNLKPAAPSNVQASYVTRALVAMGTYAANLAMFGGTGAEKVDVSDEAKANAFVKRIADSPALKLKGEVGKARDWLEKNSRKVREKIAELRAAEAPAFDADAMVEEIEGDAPDTSAQS